MFKVPRFPLRHSRIPSHGEWHPTEENLEDFAVLKQLLDMKGASFDERPAAVIVCGSDLLHVADKACTLYLRSVETGDCLPVVVTGGRGKLTPPCWSTEAEEFCKRMINRGVPRDHIILETKATNTSENMRNSKKELLLVHPNLSINSLVVVADDAQLRRAVLTAEKEFVGVNIVGGPPGYFDFDFAPADWPLDEWQQRLLWTEVNEVGRLVNYSREGMGYFSPISISRSELKAASRIGKSLMEDVSIPHEAKCHLQIWVDVLQAALTSN
jgi:hypothetical protein